MDTNRLAVSFDEQLSIVILILLVLISRHWGGMIRDQTIRSVEHWSVLLFRQTEASVTLRSASLRAGHRLLVTGKSRH